MKKNSIQIKIGFLMFLAVILLSATGYLSYRNLSSIVSSIHIEEKPELRLLTLREISMDLDKAQNSIRIYTITNDTLDIKPYYRIISNINRKVKKLRQQCVNDTVLLEQTETISRLIDKYIVTWNELLTINSNKKVVEYLKQISDRLSVADSMNNAEKGLLKLVFSKNNKNRLNEKELINDLKEIEQQDRLNKEMLMKRESQLARTGNEITVEIYDLITKIENEISATISTKASAANQLARKTYIWLAMFSLTGTILAILVMFIIVRFVRKSHAYQIALHNSKTETEKLTRIKELFMANISHEIRTPVTAISGFTEQLLHEPLDQNTIRTLKIIKTSSDHLANIINDILDFSKLQNGNMSLEKVNFRLTEVLEDVFTLFETQALRNNTKLSYLLNPDTPAVLLGDPFRLKQILINLVSNSIKFTKNGKVHYSVKSDTINSGEVDLTVEVTDTGIGIDESKIKFIFEDFTQEEMSTTRKYGGTGLGLSIVKKLIELHNGTIDCFSKKNHGTRITCKIPYIIGDEKLVITDFMTPLFIPEKLKELKILVVDDEEYNRLLFKTILERWKVRYYEALNGLEALEALKREKYDMLFMDARMPVMDGLEATHIIRNEMNISESEMPVICISAAAADDDLQKYQKAGMNAFLPKPFTEEMLLTAIISVSEGYLDIKNTDNTPREITEKVTLSGINLDNLYHISGGDDQFVKQMLISFIDTTNKGLSEMLEASLSDNWALVAELAHKLLPPCKHIGAIGLFNYLKKIEECIRQNEEVNTVKTLTEESIKEFDGVRELINVHIAKIS